MRQFAAALVRFYFRLGGNTGMSLGPIGAFFLFMVQVMIWAIVTLVVVGIGLALFLAAIVNAIVVTASSDERYLESVPDGSPEDTSPRRFGRSFSSFADRYWRWLTG